MRSEDFISTKNPLTPAGIKPATFRFVAQHLNHCATAVPINKCTNVKIKLNCRARMGVERGVYRVLVGKPEGKRPMGRPRRRWVDNIRMDLQKVGCGYMDWIGLVQYRDMWRMLVSAVMNLRVP